MFSIGHRSTLGAFPARRLVFVAGNGGPASVVEGPLAAAAARPKGAAS